MKHIGKTLGILTAAICISNAALAQQPDTQEKIKQFWDKMAKSKSVTFMLQEWTWLNASEVLPKPRMELMRTLEVTIQKPNLISIRATPPHEYEYVDDKGRPINHIFSGVGDNIQISDGKRNLLLNTFLRTYRYGAQITSVSKIRDGVADSNVLDDLFGSDPMRGLTFDADLKLNLLAVYFVGQAGNANRQGPEDRFSFDPKTGELVSKSYWRQSPTGFRETDRFAFRYWLFDAPIPRGTFDTKVPPGYRTSAELKEQLKANQPSK